jgi:hypothetical protein
MEAQEMRQKPDITCRVAGVQQMRVDTDSQRWLRRRTGQVAHAIPPQRSSGATGGQHYLQ